VKSPVNFEKPAGLADTPLVKELPGFYGIQRVKTMLAVSAADSYLSQLKAVQIITPYSLKSRFNIIPIRICPGLPSGTSVYVSD
jgi:hypothetical protein